MKTSPTNTNVLDLRPAGRNVVRAHVAEHPPLPRGGMRWGTGACQHSTPLKHTPVRGRADDHLLPRSLPPTTFASAVRILSLVALVFVGSYAVHTFHDTLSYFSDTEASPANTFTASKLLVQAEPATVSVALTDGQSSALPSVQVALDASRASEYTLSSSGLSGDACGGLLVSAMKDGDAPVYDGLLSGLFIPHATSGTWVFTLTANGGASCDGTLVFRAHHDDVGEGVGFTDTAEVGFGVSIAPPNMQGKSITPGGEGGGTGGSIEGAGELNGALVVPSDVVGEKSLVPDMQQGDGLVPPGTLTGEVGDGDGSANINL